MVLAIPRRLPMKLQSALLTLVLASLVACGGGAPADADVGKLLQTGKYEEAVKIVEGRLESVAKGTEDEKSLILDYAEGLSYTDAAKAQESFLTFAKANSALVTPKDFKHVVACLRTNEGLLQAIDVMNDGMKRWPGDTVMAELLELVKADVIKANDPAAKAKMEGLGYM